METKKNNKKGDVKLTKYTVISLLATVIAMATTLVIYFLTTL